MLDSGYWHRRREIGTYFDETAVDAWKKLTSDAPVSRIRETVRAGRRQTQETLLSWLPTDLAGKRVLDAGCGTGLLAIEVARRGAEVVAVDLSPKLVSMAEQRFQRDERSAQISGSVSFHSGDMLNGALGEFDFVVAMDSLIHYEPADAVSALSQLAARTSQSMLFTFAPRTPMLAVMHKAGKLFPKKDRSPAIVPVSVGHLQRDIEQAPSLSRWGCGRDQRIDSGFYKSHAQELIRS
jgi:magnesium-protoporphyrin O-methyltransferase